MPKFIPYFILVFISLVLFFISWKKASDKKIMIYYLCLAGLIYFFEFTILVLFKSYEYLPELFKDRYFDNIFGANVSDGFIVPLTAVFIAVFDLGIGWIVGIVLVFLGVEELFLFLHIYKHFWWKTVYTGMGLLIHFNLAKWFWHILRFHANRLIVRYGALYFSHITIQATFLYYISAVFNVVYYRVHWFPNLTRGHIAFEALFAFVDSIFLAAVIAMKAHWTWQMLVVIAGVGFNLLLHARGILDVPGYWVFALITCAQIVYLFILKYFQNVLEEKTT